MKYSEGKKIRVEKWMRRARVEERNEGKEGMKRTKNK